MAEWEAPAKLNLTLRVRSPDRQGYHPIHSLVQTVELCDLLWVEEGDDDVLDVEGADIPDDEGNLVWRAVEALRPDGGPPRLALRLTKRIPIGAGLGGGSSDAAAALLAVAAMTGIQDATVREAAARVGADVTFFLTGGTALMAGRGEEIEGADPLDGFSVAIAVPPFELSTAEVYRRWDEMEGPSDPGIGPGGLPPVLRDEAPLGNDLVPAAISIRPELGDWMTEVAATWGRPVAMSGSGPAVFAYFADLDEAEGAAASVHVGSRFTAGVDLRRSGAGRVDR